MAPRAYRWLVRLLPAELRREYGEEMCRVAEEHWRALRAADPRPSALGFWGRQGLALVREGLRARGSRPGDRKGGGGGMGGMEGFFDDVRRSTRVLLKRPAFTGLTVATLGLGIGATTAIFSAVDAVLLRDLVYEDPERAFVLVQTDVVTGERGDGVSVANIADLAASSERLSAAAVADPWSLDLQLPDRADALRGWSVSRGFFEAIGGRAELGRTFVDAEYESEGAARVVVLGHASWVDRFGGDPDIVGRTLVLDGAPHTVVGVLPSDFRFPSQAEVWTPRPARSWDGQSRAAAYLTGIARLAPGVPPAEAQAEVDRIAASLAEAHPDTNRDTGITLVPLREHLFGDVRTPLLVMMGAIGFVLLIACANVAGLMLARGTQRQREYAVRGALGAGRARLVRLIAAEGFVLATLGCLLGVALTWAGVRVIHALGPDHLPRIDALRVDGTALAFAVGASVVSALLSALAPSLRLSRPDLADALNDASRGSTGGPRGHRLRGRLVVTEVAAAVVLLVGAGLLLRSFATLLDEDLGFEPADRLALQVFAYDYATPADRDAFVERAAAAMEALPGVRRVALTSDLPGANDGTIARLDIVVPFTVAGRPAPPEGQEPIAGITQVSPGFFETMGIDLVRGRPFASSDDASAAPVVLVNETLARRHFADRNPLGEALQLGSGTTVAGPEPRTPRAREIVGVVADVRPSGHEVPPRPEVYLPLTQVSSGSLTFVLHTDEGAAAETAPAAMEAIWASNPAQSIWGAATVEAILADRLRERRFNVLLLSAFAALALVLASVGIYGLISFSVERRLGELGIRRALGGRPAAIVGLVLREGLVLAGAGVLLGLAAAFGLTRFLQGMLFGIEPTDPLTFAVLGAGVLLVALLASLAPALRAVRVDPVVVLRSD
jgi:predicted permease